MANAWSYFSVPASRRPAAIVLAGAPDAVIEDEARRLGARYVVGPIEPAAGVPPPEMDELAHKLRTWRDEIGTALLLIEHNMPLVQAVSDRVCVLDYGSKLAEGEPQTVLSDPAVLEAYLGRAASQQMTGQTPTQEVSHAEN